MGPRRHDDLIGRLQGERTRLQEFQQLLAGQIGEVIEGLDVVFPQGHEHGRRQAGHRGEFLGDAQFNTALVQPLVPFGDVGPGTLLKLPADSLEPFDARQLPKRHEGNLFDRRKPFGHQQMGNHLIHIEGLGEQFREPAELLGPPLRVLILGEDVNVPAGELRGEANILAAASDRQAQLVLRHDHFDATGILVQDHFGDFGRRLGVDHESRGVGRPRNDVDLLPLKLADHSLDPTAPHADAGTDRIDAGVVGDHGDLGATAGIAGDGLDFDDSVIDFRHFLGEQLGHELRVRTRQEDLRAPRLLAHVVNVGADPVVLAEAFSGNELVAAQDGLGPAQVDYDVAELDAPDQAGNDFAYPVLVFLVLALALGLADFLNDHLLGGLRGDSTKFNGRKLLDDEISDFKVGVTPLGLGEGNLGRLVLHLIRHLAIAIEPNLAAAAVDYGPDIVLVAVFRAARPLDRLLHGLQNLLALDTLLAGHGIGHLQEFRAGL